MSDGRKIIGIDIGGSKVHIGLVENGSILKEVKLSTSAAASREQILQELTDGIALIMDPAVAGIGIGVPGLVDEKNGIVYELQNIPSWKEVHLKKQLEDTFRLPVCITNDANAFVAGEKIYGKGKDFTNLVGITLGTGLGTGIIIDNNIYGGTLSCAGEFGGVPFLDLTLEDYCSGKFFLREFGMTGKELKTLAKNGDARALEIFEQYGHHLGSAIRVILYALAPEAIVLGGSISSCFSLFKDSMQKSISEFPYKQVTDRLVIEYSDLENAAILGSAALFKLKSSSDKLYALPAL